MIDTSWNFNEAINNIKAVKDKYIGLLSSFSIYEIKEKRIAICNIRKQIYKLNILEWQKDKLWEFMNGDVPYIILCGLRNRQN